MKNRWTKKDERQLQKLLQRRRQAAQAELEAVNPSDQAIDEFATNVMDDFRATDAWEQFMDWEHPEAVREAAIEMKEFFDGGADGNEPAQPHQKG